MFDWTQERTLAITDNAIYNIHKKAIKRCIEFKHVGGMTKTVSPSKCITEFTVHVPNTYDYRFVSEKREEIMDVIKKVYYNMKQSNCPVFHAVSKDLKDYTTTEKDMKKGSSRFPPPSLRSKEEDLFPEDSSGERNDSVPDTTASPFDTEEDLTAK